MADTKTAPAAGSRTRTPLFLILAICLAPVILALLAYYVPELGLRPSGSTNNGDLVNPQRSLPAASALDLKTRDGQPFDLRSLAGKWILVSAGPGACPETCVTKLFILRNSQASQGKDVNRMKRVWLVTDDAPVPDQIEKAYGDTIILRADPARLAAYLTPNTPIQDASNTLAQFMWIIDPLGNLMMQYPRNIDPISVRSDLQKLLRNSHIG